MLNPFSDDIVPVSVDGADIPVWSKSINDQMKVDVAVSADGKVVVLHDRPFPDYLEWVEFDARSGEMTFVTAGGKLQDLGLMIYAPMNKYVSRAMDVCVICIRNHEVRDMGLLPLVVHNLEEGAS